MGKKIKKVFGVTLALALIVCVFSACNKDTEQEKENSGNQIMSGESQTNKDLNIYGNGNLFVQYKGKTYYREYSNVDIEKNGSSPNYGYEEKTKNSKYINVINSNGKVTNVFEDDGYGNFYIMEDRFYFSGYNNKLYSVDMTGKNYIEICKGQYIKVDEEEHRVYYINENNNGALYMIDTETLKITKITNERLNVLEILEDDILYVKANTDGVLAILKLNLKDKTDTEICKINTEVGSIINSTECYVADFKKAGDKIFLSVGYDKGAEKVYSDSGLYCLNLSSNTCNLIEKGINRELLLKENNIYYTTSGNISYLKKVSADNLKIEIISDLGYMIENGMIVKTSADGVGYLDNNLNPKTLVSVEEEENFKEKYGVTSIDSNYIVKAKTLGLIQDKIYYLIELSKYNETSIGESGSYDRIASEVYMLDTKTNKKSLLYLYKIADKEEIDSGDIYEVIEEEPLAENEMYLEIKLVGKGLKDTFDVRVEEVGGLIIGKRIEYEGVHSRSEEILKIKVTKEVGAMLTVYIDGELDTQMLIEE